MQSACGRLATVPIHLWRSTSKSNRYGYISSSLCVRRLATTPFVSDRILSEPKLPFNDRRHRPLSDRPPASPHSVRKPYRKKEAPEPLTLAQQEEAKAKLTFIYGKVHPPLEPSIPNSTYSVPPWGIQQAPVANGDLVDYVAKAARQTAMVINATGTFYDSRLIVDSGRGEHRVAARDVAFRIPASSVQEYFSLHPPTPSQFPSLQGSSPSSSSSNKVVLPSNEEIIITFRKLADKILDSSSKNDHHKCWTHFALTHHMTEICHLDVAAFLFPDIFQHQHTFPFGESLKHVGKDTIVPLTVNKQKLKHPMIFYLYAAHVFLSHNQMKYFKPRYPPGVYKCRSAMKVAQRQTMERALMDAKDRGFFHLQVKRSMQKIGLTKKKQEYDLLVQAGGTISDPKVFTPDNKEHLDKLATFKFDPARFTPYIKLLKEIALSSPYDILDDNVLTLLVRPMLNYPNRNSVQALLIDLGVLKPHDNIHLKAAVEDEDMTFSFEKPAQAAADKLVASHQADKPRRDTSPAPMMAFDIRSSDFHHRIDFRNLPVFTIDSADTVEIDDGVSLDSDGWLHIHIADPSRIITPNSALDMTARSRATTVYLPEVKNSMFPMALSTGVFSLVDNETSYALTFSAKLNEDGSIQESRISPSVLRRVHRLTYDMVDDVINGKINPINGLSTQDMSILHKLYALASKRYEWRKSRGAMLLHIPSPKIDVLDGGARVNLSVEYFGPSHTLVSELMVLCGEVAANYAFSHGIPVPYRSQKAPVLSEPFKQFLAGLPENVRDHIRMGGMTTSETSSQASPHFGVGMPLYTQTTSPIRRYRDMLVHYQIKSHMEGRPLPFTLEDMDRILLQGERTNLLVKRLSRTSERFWMGRFLLQEQGRVYPAIVLDVRSVDGEDEAYVLLTDVAVKGRLQLESTAELLKVGQEVHVKVHPSSTVFNYYFVVAPQP
eukprot:TRINITY_DN5772_c0_g1_i3.p1 TRINITY_DN5772_c0_g1~~TRINITY_DN5772_c0_g1_i3.p1  ORF type:complete len:945 (+),score=189.87 TRINITY_DN5772_c0_g1_i3:1-2835(+)